MTRDGTNEIEATNAHNVLCSIRWNSNPPRLTDKASDGVFIVGADVFCMHW